MMVTWWSYGGIWWSYGKHLEENFQPLSCLNWLQIDSLIFQNVRKVKKQREGKTPTVFQYISLKS